MLAHRGPSPGQAHLTLGTCLRTWMISTGCPRLSKPWRKALPSARLSCTCRISVARRMNMDSQDTASPSPCPSVEECLAIGEIDALHPHYDNARSVIMEPVVPTSIAVTGSAERKMNVARRPDEPTWPGQDRPHRATHGRPHIGDLITARSWGLRADMYLHHANPPYNPQSSFRTRPCPYVGFISTSASLMRPSGTFTARQSAWADKSALAVSSFILRATSQRRRV